jgi:HD-GYP domain-containing protein (c-di-GMP phosphodiesterase class II)
MAEARLADLLAALSHASDLGMGQPPGSAVRSCLVAATLARQLDIPERDVAAIYYTTLLQHSGCTAYAHETAALLGGDDVAIRRSGARVDFGNARESLAFLLFEAGRGLPRRSRARIIATALRLGSRFDLDLSRANCEVATHIADRLDLDAAVQRGLNEIYERWDGRGQPSRIAGDDIALAARFAQVASQAVLFQSISGPGLAIQMVKSRSGTILDPAIATAFVEHGETILADCDAGDPMVAILEAEPQPHRSLPASRLDHVASAFALMADLKSPWLQGHSHGVSRLAEGAGSVLGLPEPERWQLRRAGFLHDLGRVGVASGIWDKPGPLTTAEWEQVRLHAYHTERILSRSEALQSLARLAGMHHERLDGSGYHRGSSRRELTMPVRILAAADACQAMTEERPYRPARSLDEVAVELHADVSNGRLDAEAVRAVLAAAGHPAGRAPVAWPAGLTDREVDVLRLAARGTSIREMATALSISPKTADHHVQHIYAKIGVSTRAGAALFAMQHDLIQAPGAGEMG